MDHNLERGKKGRYVSAGEGDATHGPGEPLHRTGRRVTTKGTTNGDEHDDVTVRHDAEDYEDTMLDGSDVADKQGAIVIGSEIQKMIMCHIV